VPRAEARVGEHGFHHRLAVVKRPLHRDAVHVVRLHGRHLPPLHLADPPVGVEDEHVHVRAALEPLNRRRSGIARGRAHDGRARAALAQDMVKQPAQELERHVLERERGAAEQLHEPQVGPQLAQRGYGAVREGPARIIRLVNHARQGVRGDGAPDKGGQHRARDRRVGLAGQGAHVHARPGGGDIEPAVGRQAAEHDLIKGQGLRVRVAGGDVAVQCHDESPLKLILACQSVTML